MVPDLSLDGAKERAFAEDYPGVEIVKPEVEGKTIAIIFWLEVVYCQG